LAILESVNVGTPQPIPGKNALTGIFKAPVEGPVTVGRLGLEDDAVLDRKHHGGKDQAVYIYFADDYRFWAEQGMETGPGVFGENLTIAGVEGRTVAVGDRFAIGEVVLEVTSHRTPCNTFAARMGERGWVKRFHQADRPGAYCRVIEEGIVVAGHAVVVTPFAGERVTVAELMAQERGAAGDGFLERALKTPLHYKMRADFEAQLAKLF
jgi:MOSC domain-containing protein YiiM